MVTVNANVWSQLDEDVFRNLWHRAQLFDSLERDCLRRHTVSVFSSAPIADCRSQVFGGRLRHIRSNHEQSFQQSRVCFIDIDLSSLITDGDRDSDTAESEFIGNTINARATAAIGLDKSGDSVIYCSFCQQLRTKALSVERDGPPLRHCDRSDRRNDHH
jgi:hypothetical protein